MANLFSPITIGGLTLDNRVVVPPMCQYMAEWDGVPAPWHTMHYGSMAISGAGLVIFEGTGVEAIGRISPNDLGLYTDAQETALKRLVSGIRSYSPAKLGIQLAHAGRKASSEPFDSRDPATPERGGWSPIGPSAVPISETWPTPAAMTPDDIDRVVESFAASAIRADRAGFDLVEIHAAHGYLISSFLSPIANRRTDEYGGSLENRLKFAVAVASAIRAVWPAAKALGARVNGTDWADGGITIEETVTLARALRAAGLDYVTVSGGGNTRRQQLPPSEPGYQVFLAERVRREAGITTMTVGMVLTPGQAEAIVASGRADLVGVARATLDDPRWALHAAQALGGEIPYPKSYWRLSAKNWPGYGYIHAVPAG